MDYQLRGTWMGKSRSNNAIGILGCSVVLVSGVPQREITGSSEVVSCCEGDGHSIRVH